MRSDRAALRILLVLVAILVVACEVPTTSPANVASNDYNGSPLPGDTFYYHWSGGKTIAVYVDQTQAPTGFDLDSATRVASARWNALARYGEFELVTASTPENADVVIRFRFAPPIVDLMDCAPPGGGAGRTVICFTTGPGVTLPLLDGGGGHVKAEVYVDPEGVTDAQLQAVGLTRQEYFVTLVTHELGHVVGIGSHSSNPQDIMNGFPRVRAPSTMDAAVLQWVWLQQPDLLL